MPCPGLTLYYQQCLVSYIDTFNNLCFLCTPLKLYVNLSKMYGEVRNTKKVDEGPKINPVEGDKMMR
jgi:hypothetical protein